MWMKKRNRLTPNEIIIYDEYAEVVVYDTYGIEVNRCHLDIEDIDKIREYKWHLSNMGYIQTTIRNINRTNCILLHRLIMNAKQGEYVDHINRNKLDCRKINLRVCTNQQNNFNKGLYSHNTSGVSGVSWDKSHNKWEANIKLNRKKKFLGYFVNFEDAVQARRTAEIKYFGEYMPYEIIGEING
jgi:hypothetical protein